MNRRLLIPVGVGALVLIVWFVALWSPQGSALSDARKRKNTALQQGATLRDQLARLQQARAAQPLKQSQLETLRIAIPDDPNLAQFILDANDAATKAGIEFLSISPTPPATQSQGTTAPPPAPGSTSGATPVPIKMAMTVSGGYFQVLDFINRLNRLPRIVVVDTLGLTGSGDASTLQVAISARMFTTSATPVSGTSTGGGATTGPGGSTTTTSSGATTTTRAGGG